MQGTFTTKVVLALWAVAFFGSLIWRFAAEPTGDGFQRGMERAVFVLVGQVVAAGLALVSWRMAQKMPDAARLRLLARLPVFATLGLILVALASVFLAMIRA
ncbi:MAG: hypothetical protein U1D06_11480 [Paracoccaceae bacterium]|nr:hypothetical protein [Paracoccaceae bacterium]